MSADGSLADCEQYRKLGVISAIGALEKVVEQLRRNGRHFTVVGLNAAIADLFDKFAFEERTGVELGLVSTGGLAHQPNIRPSSLIAFQRMAIACRPRSKPALSLRNWGLGRSASV